MMRQLIEKMQNSQRHKALTGQGPTPKILDPDREDDRENDSPFIYAFHPVDFGKADRITSYDMHQIMIQPLRQGVRLTALFDDFYDISPLKTPYTYSAEAVLKEADFSTRATRNVTRFSSTARTILRSMTSLSLSKQPSLPVYGLEDLIKAIKTSPADVIVIYSCRHPADDKDPGWSTALAFFETHRYNRHDSHAQLLSSMEAQVSFSPTIRPPLSYSHPIGMCDPR